MTSGERTSAGRFHMTMMKIKRGVMAATNKQTNSRSVTTMIIDHERCTGCGACISLCPKDTLSLSLGIPGHETPHAVIALGWPKETYRRVAGRKPVVIRYAMSGRKHGNNIKSEISN